MEKEAGRGPGLTHISTNLLRKGNGRYVNIYKSLLYMMRGTLHVQAQLQRERSSQGAAGAARFVKESNSMSICMCAMASCHVVVLNHNWPDSVHLG